MQGMWFLETEAEQHLTTLDKPRKETSTGVAREKAYIMKGTKRDWLFRVQVPGLEKNEFAYVVGNLPELGAWNHNQAIQLPQEVGNPTSLLFDRNNSGDLLFNDDVQESASDRLLEDEKEDPETHYMLKCKHFRGGRIFSRTISLPTDVDIVFRYFIAVVCESNGTKNSAKTLIIRKWETHMTPRLIRRNTPSNFAESIPDPDRFGYHNGYCKVERGWLTDETVIQFKLFNNPIKIWKNRLQNRSLFIKMTPVNLVRHNSLEMPQFGGDCVDDSLSMDTQDIVDQPAFSITEIAVMNDEEAGFKYQEQFGRAYHEDEVLVFNVAVRYPDTIAYLVDYYVYSSRTFPGDSPPSHIGFSYILPSTLQSSVGLLTVPITSTKHRPIGQLTVEYVTIKCIPDYPWDMSISYAKHWEQRWSGLDVGHRGLGTSFKCEMKNCANVRENTIASLKTASHHGADMVEFDVQLSKDMIPVIYHDFHVSISLKRKKQIDAMDMLEIPVKDLTLEQLHLLKDFCYPMDSRGKVLHYFDKDEQMGKKSVYHLAEAREKNPRFFDEDLEDHQPFPTLQAVLQELEPHVGCNVEIKWNMQLKDGTFELNHPFDLNMYLDIILKVVLEYGGERKVVFSSFNPDICIMIRLKQNKYPVVFLTQGVTAKYPTYHDPRCQTIPMAMRHAIAADILGINVHTEDILRDPSQVKIVKDAGLIIFCWGDDNNDKATIQHLKELGLHAVIYDKIDEYNAKEVKESIFLVDARESQKALIALAHCNQTCGPPQPMAISTEEAPPQDYYLDLEQSRNLGQPKTTTSTATSLGSLVKNSVGDDSLFSMPMERLITHCQVQRDTEIGDLAKDFSVCANSFGHATLTEGPAQTYVSQSTAFPELSHDDESAIDCL